MADSKSHYSSEAKKQIGKKDVIEYLVYAEEQIEQELQRVHSYLGPTLRKRLIETVEQELISSNADKIISSVDPLFQDHRVPDLKRLYMLFARVGLTELVRRSFSEFMRVWYLYVFEIVINAPETRCDFGT